MSTVALALWGLAAVALTVPFLGAARRAFGAQWVAHAWTVRVVLLVLEVGAVLVWALALRGVWRFGAEPAAAAALLGAVLALAGALLAAWAKLALGPWFSVNLGVQRGHRLVTTGPYGIVRHPIYLGIVLFVAGSAGVWNDAGLIGLAVVLGILLSLHVPVEERLFDAHFGEPWRAYRDRVPALFPWPRGRRRAA
jgi:protein-S-isoprenylcysteine O-methyltransferase Ste14